MGNLTDKQKDAIWEDIDECLNSSKERQPGDIDKDQMIEHLKEIGSPCSRHYARTKMIELAATGKWEYIKVYDHNLKNIRSVLRKVKN